jgi:hypothetical protein
MTKPVTEFFKRPKSKDGYRNDCMKCNHDRNKKWHNNNKKHISEHNRKYRENLDVRFSNWKYNAFVRKIEWNLNFDDIKNIPLICFYTNIKLTKETNKFNTVSLDRMDSNKGYTKDNVVFCCAGVNVMKQSSSILEFLSICKIVVMNKKNIISNINHVIPSTSI